MLEYSCLVNFFILFFMFYYKDNLCDNFGDSDNENYLYNIYKVNQISKEMLLVTISLNFVFAE